MAKCPTCAEPIPDGTAKCPRCGSDLPAANMALRASPRAARRRWVPWMLGILVIGVVVLILRAFDVGRRPTLGQRTESICNLKNIGLATLGFASSRGMFPPGHAEGTPKRAGHSWAVAILPNMEQRNLYNEIDFEKPWDDPANARILPAEIPGYTNPAVPEMKDARGYGLIHYAGNVRLLGRDPALASEDVTDGASNTLMIGEVNAGFRPWGEPDNLRDPARGLNGGPHTFGAPWADGSVHFAFADGSVRAVAGDTSPDVLRALATPDGGETIHRSEF